MDFSIPDTTDVSAKQSSNQQAHTLFNIHINGVHHCSLRYSHLRTFHDELQLMFPSVISQIDPFPPKKMFGLSSRETEERRVLLEHYLKSVALNKFVRTSSFFDDFFLRAQCETFASDASDTSDKLDLTVRLLNNHEIIIEGLSSADNTAELLDACASKIQLTEDIASYFGLYLYDTADNQLSIIRPLHNFESPYLSLKQTNTRYGHACIVLKKSYWNAEWDLALLDDRRARNLLFVQAQHEIEQARGLSDSEIDEQLQSLRDTNAFKDYILLARTAKFYGHIMLKDCSILYPIADASKQKRCQCLLAVGNNELIFCLSPEKESKKKAALTSASAAKELILKVTRIRCWKTNWTKDDVNIAVEYLIKKDTLEWITIHTKQAALVSSCLQSMVDEIVAKKVETASSAAPATEPAATVERRPKPGDGLTTRTEADWERLSDNKNYIFDDDL